MADSRYPLKALLQSGACTHCQECVRVCPAADAAQDGQLSAVYRLQGLARMLQGRSGLLARLRRRKPPSLEEQQAFGETVFRCTLCGNCEAVCPVGIRLRDLWLSLRRDLAAEACAPGKINMIRENLEESRNVFAEDNEERAEWVDDLRGAPEDGWVRETGEVVYFTGCVAAYFPLAQKIPMALAEILKSAAVDFTLLGEDEWCCGFPLLGAGLPGLMDDFISHNLAMVKQCGARQVVFACPSCYQTWREHYPREITLFHATEFLLALVREGRVVLKELPLKVTYHDPCDLGRGAKVYEVPRELIRSIPGVELVELPHNREACRCCGGGGNLEMIDPGLAREIARAKIEEVLGTGAQAVVTACQQCVRTLATYVKRNKISLEVLDITQLLQRALR